MDLYEENSAIPVKHVGITLSLGTKELNPNNAVGNQKGDTAGFLSRKIKAINSDGIINLKRVKS